uniref:Uncharacterized protein n=1 Tax=Vespula pensylvanica TaxID=30213 RepID=A0A834P522_VESPE|nr:hypothetical protein H0235_005525 [Vespula pensylvanica]
MRRKVYRTIYESNATGHKTISQRSQREQPFEWYVLEKGGGNGGSSKKRGWIGNSTIRGYPALLCLSLRRQSALTRPPMLYSLETPR